MVIVPTGAIAGPFVALYDAETVIWALYATIAVTGIIGTAGAIYPESVEHWGGFFLVALLILIFGEITHTLLVANGIVSGGLGLWDWAVLIVFSGLIFYDMNRAMRMSYTLDNAVDNAVALYLDVFNIFIRILSIMGDNDD